jgi:putative tricarboxylic transport membrane protein
MTVDRVGGVALVLLALFTMEETYRGHLPLGSLQNPGPAYVPVLLATLLLVLGIAVAVLGGGAARVAEVGWSEWKHGVMILAVCAFMALALERLGYRLTIAIALAFLIWVLERQSILSGLTFAVLFAMGSFYLFETLLRVPLPRGPWGL